jgi:PAS domain S-box-containing protein
MEGPVNVLLVDDQDAKLLAYGKILAELGENLIKCRSGREALSALLHHDVAVALIDVHMPELGGLELAAMLREHPRYQRTAIIFVSALDDNEEERVRGYQLGAVDYLMAPLVPELLRAKVSAFADLYRKTRQLEVLNHELEARVEERTAALSTAAMELRANEARLHLALESARAASWDWDAATDRLDWTPRFCELHGLTSDVPESFESVISHVQEEDRARLTARFHHMLATPGDDQWNEVFSIVHPRRGHRHISGLGRMYRDDTGRATRMSGIDLDVTERVETEQALEAADRRKDRFLNTLSHELRNPLAPMLTAVQLIEQTPGNEERHRKAYAVIQRQALQMVQLVNDVLDISRITGGKIELQRTRVTLEQVVDRGLAQCASRLEERQILVEVIAPPRKLWIDGDLGRLVQVVVNLLSNASKFTEPHGRVEIRATSEGDEAVLSIRDTGIGIEPALLPSIFEPFSRASNPGYGATGLGIGLSIVRELVAMHGGTVHAKSEGRAKGAEFEIRLPLCGPAETVDVA